MSSFLTYCKLKVKFVLNAEGLAKMSEVLPPSKELTPADKKYTPEDGNSIQHDECQREGPELSAGAHCRPERPGKAAARLKTHEESRGKATKGRPGEAHELSASRGCGREAGSSERWEGCQ